MAQNYLLVQYTDDSQFIHWNSVHNLDELMKENTGILLHKQKDARIPVDTTIEFVGCCIRLITSVKNIITMTKKNE